MCSKVISDHDFVSDSPAKFGFLAVFGLKWLFSQRSISTNFSLFGLRIANRRDQFRYNISEINRFVDWQQLVKPPAVKEWIFFFFFVLLGLFSQRYISTNLCLFWSRIGKKRDQVECNISIKTNLSSGNCWPSYRQSKNESFFPFFFS